MIQACGGSARRKGEVSAAIDQTPSFRNISFLSFVYLSSSSSLSLSRGGEGKPEAIVIASIIVIIIKIESWRTLLHELLKVFFWMVEDRSKHAPLCTHLFNNVDVARDRGNESDRVKMNGGFVDGWDFFFLSLRFEK